MMLRISLRTGYLFFNLAWLVLVLANTLNIDLILCLRLLKVIILLIWISIRRNRPLWFLLSILLWWTFRLNILLLLRILKLLLLSPKVLWIMKVCLRLIKILLDVIYYSRLILVLNLKLLKALLKIITISNGISIKIIKLLITIRILLKRGLLLIIGLMLHKVLSSRKIKIWVHLLKTLL
jgi:hypothetical protein